MQGRAELAALSLHVYLWEKVGMHRGNKLPPRDCKSTGKASFSNYWFYKLSPQYLWCSRSRSNPYTSFRQFKIYEYDPSIKLNAKMDLLQVPLVNAAIQKTAETFWAFRMLYFLLKPAETLERWFSITQLSSKMLLWFLHYWHTEE